MVNKTLMVMAGGTGGHVYPAMAVADYLRAQGWRIVWLATEGGMENRLIEGKGYDVSVIRMKGVRGNGINRWLMLPMQLAVAISQSYGALRQYQPGVVLGMGGFAAFPGGVTAWLLRRPLVIHEQNSIAGLTNRSLANFAKRVLAAFPSAFGNKAQLVGNPVRKEITQVEAPEQRMAGRQGPLRLLVVGGSLGAQALNEVIPQALARLPLEQRPQVVHQAGVKHIEQLQQHYRNAGVEADTRAFIADMAEMYAWSDLVICRAGALTVAELSAAGVGSVLVPFPYAVDDHQTYNAAYLVEGGAALLVQQKDLTIGVILDILKDMNRDRLLDMALKARALGKPQATATVANICAEVAR
ncbi:undecaprenyldiphospho-muramoylpentapeptide beta-N-acetylglucosaminyltransferase [Methylobacillus caricis]|uniref:undecaprenyldiphospho-muramoylpentapeptide beta-N-acetylglucosaminyltransferase n=1 Tax=Methylobacillus caricis TaxID=1971611 RepID=UPI001D000385|nr:undecaprenyldiphospho-muramoylpentapeptide beta-N-acetylglucosaminyltransferase [Methylobacillus caricis]MCB5188585.1 undecaprenyldiphospho-muramoylpentapeptide beta-N-acetylglucosaminyltransferase [Methylobacillus caricis]